MKGKMAACIVATNFGLAGFAGQANADGFEIAQQLGTVLGSEAFCGLSYDAAAIGIFIEANVSESDMEFPGLLTGSTTLAEFANGEMRPSAKIAHCVQITRIAKKLNFIE